MIRILAALLLLPLATSAQEACALAGNGLALEQEGGAPSSGRAPGVAAWSSRLPFQLSLDGPLFRGAGAAAEASGGSPARQAPVSFGAVRLDAGLAAPLGVLPAERRLAVIGYLRVELPDRWPALAGRGGGEEGREEEGVAAVD